jgi:DNA polymerase theta
VWASCQRADGNSRIRLHGASRWPRSTGELLNLPNIASCTSRGTEPLRATWEIVDMDRNNGVLHETSVQAARKQYTSYSTTSLAGVKRALSDQVHVQQLESTTQGRRVQQRRTLSLTAALPRLTASPVCAVGPQYGQKVTEYSQRIVIGATPGPSIDSMLLLSHSVYGLPRRLVQNFASLGIESIYPWQKNCLLGPGLLDGQKNLVYSAPTGGGKSLVADSLSL